MSKSIKTGAAFYIRSRVMEEQFCPHHGLVMPTVMQECPVCGQETMEIDADTWYGVLAGPAREKTGLEKHFGSESGERATR